MSKTTKEKLLEKIHIKWLSKAKTAIINGDEMTVLPYGYLTQACSEAIDQTGEETIRKVEEMLPEEILDDYGEYYSTEYKNGFNDCLEQSLKSLVNK